MVALRASLRFAMPPTRPLRLLVTLLVLAGLLLSMHWAGQARQRALLAEAETAHEQLGLYANSLRTLLERYRSPAGGARPRPGDRPRPARPLQERQQQALNLKLQRINTAARSSTLELLDRNGLAVAASNWDLPTAMSATTMPSAPTSARPSPRAPAASTRSG
jgi:two-component system C4-dicarboxylate transport sensor histidine kinase DctB